MLRFVSLLLVLQLFVSASPAQGQLIQRLRARRAAGETPLLDRALNLTRRLQGHEDLAPNITPEPTPADQQQELQARDAAQRGNLAGTRSAAPELLLPPMASLNNAELQQEISHSHGALQQDLARFSSAKSWQGFLTVPERLGESDAVDVALLDSLVKRYERVANNEKFSQVSSLASFDRTLGLLEELSSRLEQQDSLELTGGPLLGDPKGTTSANASIATASFDEEPPAKPISAATVEPKPAPQPVRSSQTGERSILVRRQ